MKKIQILLLLLLFSTCAYPQFSGLKKGLKGIAKKVLTTEQTSTDETTSEAPAEERATPFIPNKDLTFTPAEAIDLGLPSGTKWASYNIGASKPEEFGGYYAWGETEVKEVYNEETYGFKTEKTTLEPKDDVASIKWGAGWYIPTNKEFEELIDNCTWTRVVINNVDCCQATGPNGNSIILPAAGQYFDSKVVSHNSNGETNKGYYWTNERYRYNDKDAAPVSFNADRDHKHNPTPGIGSYIKRYIGCTIRPVTK